MTPRKIRFEDIRKGDLIRVQHKARHGVRATREGVAGDLLPGDVWVTDEGGALAFKDAARSITLLDRPTPDEPKGVGAVVETSTGTQLVSVTPDPGGNRWVRLWREGRSAPRRTAAWTWTALVGAYGSITIVREGV